MYELLFTSIVHKQQAKIPKKELDKIKKLILDLAVNPRPVKSKKLVGGDNEYRVRYGDWRVLYSIEDKKRQVIIYGILHRKEAYR